MIAVTGAMGFIGSNLCHALAARGHELLAVDEVGVVPTRRHLGALEGLQVVDRRRFARWLDANDARLDALSAVFHLGACSDTTERRWSYLSEVNVGDSLRLAGYCQARGVPLIYASSAAVYGDRRGFREHLDCEHPINLYAKSKKMVDDHVRSEVLPHPAAQIVGLRYFNVYGPREGHKGAMASVAYKMYQQLRASGEVTLFSGSHGFADGQQSRDFVYVDDVIAVNLWFLDHPQHSGVFNVGTGVAEPFNAIARAVLGHAGRGSLRYVPFPEALRDQYQAWTQANLERLRAAGCAHPMRGVGAGVRDYMDWLSAAP